MSTEEQRLILEGKHDRFVIGADFWGDIVSWAIDHGWVSDAGSDDVNPGHCREFSDEESRRLGEALDIIGGKLILESTGNVSEEFIESLANALLTLQKFAETGGFYVRKTSEPRS